MPEFSSLPALLFHRASEIGDSAALRHCTLEGWQDVTYADYAERVVRVASALIAEGIAVGDRIGLLAPNSVDWLITDLAIQAVGAITVPFHVAQSIAELSQQCQAVALRAMIVVPELANRVPAGVQTLTIGATFASAMRDEVLARIRSRSRDSLATILFTSGTTGTAKGVMLTQGNLLSNAESAQAVLPWGRGRVMLNFLPFSHIYARVSDAFQALVAGATLALADSADAMPRQLKEIRPDYVRGVPRFYEKMLRLVDSEPSRLSAAFGGRTRWMFVGGAGLPERIAQQYALADLTLLQGYGLTETSPTITVNRPERQRIGSVGVPLPGYEVRIADDGEILTRGPHVMHGYWNDLLTTAKVLHDGWFHTGDLGYIDADGFLFVTGRKKDLIVLSTGRKVVPFVVESRLQAEPSIEHAIVFGDGRPFPVALLTSSGQGRITSEVVRGALRDLAPWEQIRRFAILPRSLRMDLDELTLTQKVRREVIQAHFDEIIERMYADCGS